MHKKLEQVQVENERLVEKYEEMKDKEHCDITVQVENIKLDETYKDEKQHDNTIQKADSVCVDNIAM